MRHNILAQFLLIASLALGSSSAIAGEVSDLDPSSQNMSEAEESISEELKSIYQEEVDQVLAEGISYSEEERLSDFPDLDSLLTDDIIPTRVAKISADQKAEKRKDSNSELGVQNQKSTSGIFSVSPIFSQNCPLGLNVLLPNLKTEQGIRQEFLPRAETKSQTWGQDSLLIRGVVYASFSTVCAPVFSLYLNGEGAVTELACSAENQRNLLLGAGVPSMIGWILGKTTENAARGGFSSEFDQIQGLVQAYGKFYENSLFSRANLSQGEEIGKSGPSVGYQVAGGFSAVKLEAWSLNQEMQSSLKKVSSKAGQDSHKFSSGRPTPEILT
ncbi:hypothetical protein V6Z05_13810 [Leptospira venezuelensis]|uniref:hypothetical protein n=1 Tax=Leptospira venezuelensis TaxID=1958811 RepID=UPI001F488357|nr:hypothetical protein [Leptospira venezuelensis]